MSENKDDELWAREEKRRQAEADRDRREAEAAIEQARRDAEKGKK